MNAEPNDSTNPNDETLGLLDPAERLLQQWLAGQRPELSSYLANLDALTPIQVADIIRVDQQQRWQLGERPLAESYLHSFAEVEHDDEAAVDVIYNEYLLRQQYDQLVDLDHFLQRFPRHLAPLKNQIEFHAALEQDEIATSTSAQMQPATHQPIAQTTTDDSLLSDSVALPRRFGRYLLVDLLGSGGMGTVYLAQDSELQRQVALKVPKLGRQARDSQTIQRFYREARVAASLSHPHLCPIHDIGCWRGLYFLTMPYLQGETLAGRIQREGRVDIAGATRVAREIAEAMSVVHQAGIVHRDLKPANILMIERGDAVVMDYGLATWDRAETSGLTSSGVVLGTPAYVAPENLALSDEAASRPAADIYSLGVMLYEMLAGRVPFRGSLHQVIGQIVSHDPTPLIEIRPDLDPALVEICHKAMAKDPSERYDTMDSLARALQQYEQRLHSQQVAAGALEAVSKLGTRGSRRAEDATNPGSAGASPYRMKVSKRAVVTAGPAAALPPAAASPDAATGDRDGRTSKRRTMAVALALIILSGVIGAVLLRPTVFGRSAGPDALQVESSWSGKFQFRAPLQDYEGDVSLRITQRTADQFTGEYATENASYVWKIRGSVDSDWEVRWRVTEVIREREPRPNMIGVEAVGRIQGDRLELVINIPAAIGATDFNTADLRLMRVTESRRPAR